MALEITPAQIARMTRKHVTKFWGQDCDCEPVFIDQTLGDGMQLVAITPLNTRPNYYLIRIDSDWSVYNRDTNALCEHLDEIYDAIEDQVGRRWNEDDDGEQYATDWPAMDDENGVSWCTAMDLLEEKAHA